MRTDYGSRAEADADAFERAHAEPEYEDTPEGRGFDPREDYSK